MPSLSRALLLAAAMLAVFLVAVVSLQTWSRREAVHVRAGMAERASAALEAALALAPRDPTAWDQAYRDRLGAALQGSIFLHRDSEIPAAGQPERLRVTQPLPGWPGWFVTVDLEPAPAGRWELLNRRSLALLALLALTLAALPMAVALLSRRTAPTESRAPWRQARAEAAGLERFARLTVERGAALDREHDARRRAEEDLAANRTLLDRSLDERIRLGRELHDNISQTLYAVTLTLESVRRNMTAAPAIEQRLDQCMAELRRLNQNVRAYIRELEPDAVHHAALAPALQAALASVAEPHAVAVEHRLEDDVVGLLPAGHAAEIVNLVREAASNAVRHGRARHLTLRAARGDDSVVLALADDGAGFDPASAAAGGHGLANMRARAAALGGSLDIDSAPGKGTRVVLTLPIAPSS